MVRINTWLYDFLSVQSELKLVLCFPDSSLVIGPASSQEGFFPYWASFQLTVKASPFSS